MKLNLSGLSNYVKNNKRFSILSLIVIVVLLYVSINIFADMNIRRNMDSESDGENGPLFSDEIVIADNGDEDKTAEENNYAAENEEEYNIYLTEDKSSDNGMSGHEAEAGPEIEFETESVSKDTVITKEEIEAMKEVLAERAAQKAAEEAAAEAEAKAAAEEAEKELEEKNEPEPKPVYKPEPEPEPEPEPVVETKNIELIVHIHFEDENGKSLSGQVVQIIVSQGGGDVVSASSDGQDARISIPAVNSIITGQEVAGFVSEGDKYVSLSNDDSVKHVSYKYKKLAE
jgi:hypothetical protein